MNIDTLQKRINEKAEKQAETDWRAVEEGIRILFNEAYPSKLTFEPRSPGGEKSSRLRAHCGFIPEFNGTSTEITNLMELLARCFTGLRKRHLADEFTRQLLEKTELIP